jgi:hypothetical protein
LEAWSRAEGAETAEKTIFRFLYSALSALSARELVAWKGLAKSKTFGNGNAAMRP